MPQTTTQARFGSIRSWVALSLVWAAVVAWSHRNEMDPDGFSYLQMAARSAGGDWSSLINSYWSPGYPALLAVLLTLLRPAPETAFAVAHLLNYLLFGAAAGAFVYFLRGWLARNRENAWLLVPLGFVLFLKFGLDWLGVHGCTPDLGVGVMVLLAGGIVCRLGEESRRLLPPVMLGLVLGCGYYFKAAMFPLSIFFLILLLCVPPPQASRGLILLAALSFAAVAAPLVALQTRSAGVLSFGESGRMNYAWYVNGVKGIQHGGPLDPEGHFIHPPRRLTEHPVTLEFGTPVTAAYPLWFDPYYWSQGIKTSFHIKQQIAALRVTMTAYGEMLMELVVLVAGAVLLFATSQRPAWFLNRYEFLALAWPLCAFGLYALVHTELRFFGGFMILFWTAILSAGLRSTRIVSRGAIVALMGISLLIPTSFRLVLAGGRSLSGILQTEPTMEIAVGRALRNLGLREGDGILVVGETFEPYYAWTARLNVVAQVPDQDELWNLSPSDFQDWLTVAARSGAKALVAMDRPSYANQVPWQDLPMSSKRSSTIGGGGPHRYSIYRLP